MMPHIMNYLVQNFHVSLHEHLSSMSESVYPRHPLDCRA